jgi:hypothetical protein
MTTDTTRLQWQAVYSSTADVIAMYDGMWAMQMPGNALYDDDTNVCTGFFLAKPTPRSILFWKVGDGSALSSPFLSLLM